MTATEDLANAMLADRIAVISDHETFEEIYEAAVAGDDEARKIIWTLSEMKAHHDREGFCCVECNDELSSTEKVGATIVFYSTNSDDVGGSVFCVSCARRHHDKDDFFAAFCEARPPTQAGHA
jgi:hypothetical protein